MSKKPAPDKVKKNPAGTPWYHLNSFKARLLIIITCTVCYGNTVFDGFAFDDDLTFTQNTYVQQGLAGIPGILTHPYYSTQSVSADYRPIASISYAIEKQFFGNSPLAGHVMNVALYIILCLVAFNVLETVLALGAFPTAVSLIIVLLYAVHPAHTEVVSSIKNRDEILSLLFALLAFQYAFKYFLAKDLSLQYFCFSLGFLILSFFSKLTNLPMIAIIVLLGLFMVKPGRRKNTYWYFAAMVPVVWTSFHIILTGIKRPNHFFENPLSNSPYLSVLLGTTMETLLFYFKLMLIPYPLSFYYGFNTLPMISISDLPAVFSFLLYLFLFACGLLLYFRKSLSGFFILAFIAAILLYSNLVTIYPGIVAERVLFAPSLWFIAAAVLLLYQAGGFADAKAQSFFKSSIRFFGIFIFFLYTWLCIQRNFDWKDTMTLMSSDVHHLENSTLANFFYASLLQGTGESTFDSTRSDYLNTAKKYYRKSLAVSPDYAEPYFKLGMIYEYDEGRNDSAFEYFKKSYSLDSAVTETQFQLGKLYLIKGNFKTANILFDSVYRKIPADTFNLFFYAQGLIYSGDTAKAFRMNDSLFKIAPGNFLPYLNRGMFYKFSGNMPLAQADLERALQMGCTEPALISTLQNYYLETGQTDKAIALQKRFQRPT